MERECRERGPMERKSGCRMSSSRTRRASNACCTDRRFRDRTHGPYFAKLFGVPRKISSYSRKYSRTTFPGNPACELWDRENDELFRIFYHTCKNVTHSLLQQLCPVDGSGARGNGQEAFNFLRNRYEGRSEARVRSLLACLLYTSPSPRDKRQPRMPSSA